MTGLWGGSYLDLDCQQSPTEYYVKGKTRAYREGKLTVDEYTYGITNQAIQTPSPVQGLAGNPCELTPVLGLASDCSAQCDCRGWWRNSTRVRCPRNWTGVEKKLSYRQMRGNGAASMTPASSSRPLPVTQHMGRDWLSVETVESREGVR